MKLINRPIYTERIRPFIGKGIIKVLTGQRRVGKSCILMQLMEDIKKDNPQANIIYINMEHEEFRMIHNDSDLFLYLKDRMPLDKNNYLFIDEIQDGIHQPPVRLCAKHRRVLVERSVLHMGGGGDIAALQHGGTAR